MEDRQLRSRGARWAGLAGVLALIGTAAAQPTTIVQNDWEDGTLQGWIPRGGGVVLSNTTETAHGGTHSLKPQAGRPASTGLA